MVDQETVKFDIASLMDSDPFAYGGSREDRWYDYVSRVEPYIDQLVERYSDATHTSSMNGGDIGSKLYSCPGGDISLIMHTPRSDEENTYCKGPAESEAMVWVKRLAGFLEHVATRKYAHVTIDDDGDSIQRCVDRLDAVLLAKAVDVPAWQDLLDGRYVNLAYRRLVDGSCAFVLSERFGEHNLHRLYAERTGLAATLDLREIARTP